MKRWAHQRETATTGDGWIEIEEPDWDAIDRQIAEDDRDLARDLENAKREREELRHA